MSFLADIQQFSKDGLKPTSTLATLPDGRQYDETKDKYGRTVRTLVATGGHLGYLADVKPDLQVGEVLPGLIMGSQDVAADLNLLTQHNVTHILNVASMVENLFPDEFRYKRINILDIPDTDIVEYFGECVPFIDDGRRSGCVLVHCNAGISRSASIVIGYLMKTEGMDFEAAFNHLKSKRPGIRPNDGFLKQLKVYCP